MKVLKTCNKDNETPRRKLQEINQQFYECLQEALQSDTESVPSSHPPSDLQNGEEPVLPSREEPKAD